MKIISKQLGIVLLEFIFLFAFIAIFTTSDISNDIMLSFTKLLAGDDLFFFATFLRIFLIILHVAIVLGISMISVSLIYNIGKKEYAISTIVVAFSCVDIIPLVFVDTKNSCFLICGIIATVLKICVYIYIISAQKKKTNISNQDNDKINNDESDTISENNIIENVAVEDALDINHSVQKKIADIELPINGGLK